MNDDLEDFDLESYLRENGYRPLAKGHWIGSSKSTKRIFQSTNDITFYKPFYRPSVSIVYDMLTNTVTILDDHEGRIIYEATDLSLDIIESFGQGNNSDRPPLDKMFVDERGAVNVHPIFIRILDLVEEGIGRLVKS